MKNIIIPNHGIKDVIKTGDKLILPRILIKFNNGLQVLAIKHEEDKFRLAILDQEGEPTTDYFKEIDKGISGRVFCKSSKVNNYIKDLAGKELVVKYEKVDYCADTISMVHH